MITGFFKRVWGLRTDGRTRKFIAHNRRVFRRGAPRRPRGPIVLFELTGMQSAQIAYSYLANVLADRYGATIYAYHPQLPTSEPKRRFIGAVKRALRLGSVGVYNSFGSGVISPPVLSADQSRRAAALYDEIRDRLATKEDVIDLKVQGVWIGDLVYDSYLMDYRKGTIDLAAADFEQALRGSVRMFVYWDDFLREHDVRAINVSHCVYNVAIPLRIAVHKGIPAFQVNATHGYRLKPENLFAYTDFHYFRSLFATLPPDVRRAGLAEAAQRIARRFSGEVGVDMRYSKKSAYGAFKEQRLLAESPRKKILIATHCFFDSPHSYGRNLFPDFYEWLDFLGRLSEETDYDWYIKTHHDYLPGTREIIDGFVAKYPRFTLLPADSSHHQIIAEGIDLTLTVWGTIGFEYALLGIPVINASVNNPHVAYGFNFHPKTIEEYGQLLRQFAGLQLKVNQEEVYESYFMQHIYNTQNWLFDDYEGVIEEIGGYDAQFTSKVYESWINHWTPAKHTAVVQALGRFVDSGDFRLHYHHTGHKFDAASLKPSAAAERPKEQAGEQSTEALKANA